MTNTINGTITTGVVITVGGSYTSPLIIGSSGAVQVSGAAVAISSTIGTPTLVNAGTIASTAGVGVDLTAGGHIGNSGLITAAYAVTVGGSAGYLTNSGTILATGSGGDGVLLNGGGFVINHAVPAVYHGVIQAQGTSGVGVAIANGIGTIVNYGIIAGGVLGDGVALQAGGTVINHGGYPIAISGGDFGVLISGGAGYVRNQAFITGSAVAGIRLQSGTVVNILGGQISGIDGIEMIGGLGTVTNYGAIRGTNTGIRLGAGGTIFDDGAITAATAIDFGAGNSVLKLGFSYSISGLITASGTGNQLQLLGLGPATLFSQFAGFDTLAADALSYWSLTGQHDLSGVTIEGMLRNAGTLSVSPGLVLASSVDLINSGVVSSSAVTVTGSAATLQNTGSVSGGVTVLSAGVVDNAGTLGIGAAVNGGQLINEASGTIVSSGVPISATGGATIVDAGDVIGGATAIYLGGTGGNLLRLLPGALLTGAVVDSGAGDILALGSGASAGTLAGVGSAITGFHTFEVDPSANWTVGGSFSGGIQVGANSTVDLAAGSSLTATGTGVFGGPGSVINNGAIKSNGSGVGISGGSVNNAASSASISGIVAGIQLTGANGTVTNVGTVIGTGSNGRGIKLVSGAVRNTATNALISGNLYGIYSRGGPVTVTNAGTIVAAGTGGISSYSAGVMLRSGGTVSDTGTIISGGSIAIYMGGTGGNRLELGAGYYLTGGIYLNGTSNSFALVSGTASGSHVPLASFSAITVDNGAVLTLVGTQNTIASGSTLSVSGTIADAGVVTLAGGNLLALGAGYSLPAFVTQGKGNGLEFLSGTTGTLTNFTSRFANFSSIAFDAGSSITIADAEAIGAGTVVSGTFAATSSITNRGTIGGIKLNGGLLHNVAGASAISVFGSGIVDNYGSINVLYINAGTINNHSLISYLPFFVGTLNNFGTLSGIGDFLRSTNLINNAALIQSGLYGVSLTGTLINSGTIAATSASSIGVELQSQATLVDSGTISGAQFAVSLSQFGGNLLVLESGYNMIGGISAPSAANTIELSNALGAVGFHYTYSYYGLNLRNNTIAFGNTIAAPITLYDDKPGDTFAFIKGFNAVGDAIDFTALSDSSGTASYQVIGNHVKVTGDGSYAVLTLASPAVPFVVRNDGSGHPELLVAPCFAEGTRIRTPRGYVAVEALSIGDDVCVGGVRTEATRPVKWLGHRHVDCERHPDPRKVWPVRIFAHAFGRDRPCRDLYLSPDHAIFIDGALIPVKCLIDDSAIVQVPRRAITYYHVELPRHDVLFAEDLAVESYLETGSRANFDNGSGPVALHPDFSTRVWEADACAPLVVAGPLIEQVLRRLRGGLGASSQASQRRGGGRYSVSAGGGCV